MAPLCWPARFPEMEMAKSRSGKAVGCGAFSLLALDPEVLRPPSTAIVTWPVIQLESDRSS